MAAANNPPIDPPTTAARPLTEILLAWLRNNAEHLLLERDRSIEERLLEFYLDYTTAIHARTWAGICLFSD